MPPINGVNGAARVSSAGSDRAPVSLTVAVPSAKPTRNQVADAFHAHFDFSRNDTAFLKNHFCNVDSFAYFARTLEYDPRSVQVTDGKATIRLEVSTEAYQTMRRLAEIHHPQSCKAVPTPVNSKEAAQAKQVYDTSSVVKDRLHRQVDQAQSRQGKSAEGIGSFLEGAVAGDFSDNESWSKTGGQIAAGAIPVYGQIADARDTVAALHDVWHGKEGAGVNLLAAGIGWVPVVGDGIKAGMHVGRRALKEGAEEVVDRAVTSTTRNAAEGNLRRVSTGGLRNEVPLTEAQKVEALSYARALGVPDEAIFFSDNMNTSYKMLFGVDRLYIGTDVLPAVKQGGLSANSRITMKGAIAHEVTGHRTAELAGRTQAAEVLEEAQASIRAARFAPDLTSTERMILLRDAIERLHKQGIKVKEVKEQLWITNPQ